MNTSARTALSAAMVVGLSIVPLVVACTASSGVESPAPPETVTNAPAVQAREGDNTQVNAPVRTSAGCEELGSLRATGVNVDVVDNTESFNVPLANRPVPSRIAVIADGAPSALLGTTVALGVGVNDNYATCSHCLAIAVGCAATCQSAAWFFPRQGTATFSSLVGSSSGSFAGTFEDVVLEQVTLDPTTKQTTKVVGGACFHVTNLTFSASAAKAPSDGGATSPEAGQSSAPKDGGGSDSGSDGGSSSSSSGTGGGGGGGGVTPNATHRPNF